MRYEVKSLGAWAFVKVSFFLNLIIGFVIGLLYAGFLGLMIFAASAMPFEGMGAAQQDLEAIGPIFLILLPIWGFFAVAALAAANLLGVPDPTQGFEPAVLLYMPIFLSELILAVWLIVKGFKQPAVAAEAT